MPRGPLTLSGDLSFTKKRSPGLQEQLSTKSYCAAKSLVVPVKSDQGLSVINDTMIL